MNILLLVDDYLPSTKAAPVMMRQLGRVLTKTGHNVTLLTPSPDVKEQYELSQEEERFSVIHFRAGRIKNMNFIRRAVNELLLSWHLIRLSRRVKPAWQADLIISYVPTIFFGLGILFLKRSLHCQAFMILRDIFPQWTVDNGILHPYSPVTLFFRIFEKVNYMSADRIFVQSQGNLPYFEHSAFRNRVSVLYNWFDPDFQYIRGTGLREKYGLQDRVIFFYGGNIGHAQDMQNLVRLVQNMKPVEKAFFIFVGKGDEFELVKNAKEQQHLDNLLLLPAVSQNEYFPFLDQVDVGLFSLHPSHKTQNFPGKLLGYMAYGKPILGSVNRNNDVKDVINQSGAGFVAVNPDDELFASYAKRLAGNEEERKTCGLAAKQLLLSHFNVHNAVKELLDCVHN